MNHYFDGNATTPLRPEARAAWLEAADEFWHNPSSPSSASARVHAKLEQAREELAALLGVSSPSVVFNSGATEGNRDVLAYFHRLHPGRNIVVSAIEHPAILENARADWGGKVLEVGANALGQVNVSTLANYQDKKVSLFSLMAANNETGVIQPWQECLEIAHRRGASMHIDATQWIGKESLDGLSGAEFITGSGHKFGGPKGVGFMVVDEEHSGFCGQRGGAQENDHRAGTENLPGIMGMVAALKAQEAEREDIAQRWREGRNLLEDMLLKDIDGLKIWGAGAPRLANTSSLCLPEGEGIRWVRRLDQRGFIVSTGSACATGKAGLSHVLHAMSASPEEAGRTIRISATATTQTEDWRALAETIMDLWRSPGEVGGNSQVIQI